MGYCEKYCIHFKDRNRFIELPCRCQNCINSVPLDNNCELNSSVYLHCTLSRGEETKNVWHKYKKYYKDYSIVNRDGFCDEAEKALKEREQK
jgi:hypothetical protein